MKRLTRGILVLAAFGTVALAPAAGMAQEQEPYSGATPEPEPTVLGKILEREEDEAPPAVEPAVEEPSGDLAFTGGDVTLLFVTTVTLFVTGVAILRYARHRREAA